MNYTNTTMQINDDFNSGVSSFDFLDEYSDYFSEINILGEGNYGVILDGGYEKVYKLGRNQDYSGSLRREYHNHIKFYMGFEDLKSKDGNKQRYKNFRIPEVARYPEMITGKISGEELFIYEMEKIDGSNLLSYLIKQELEKIGVKIDLNTLNDKQVEELYTQHIGKSIDALRNGLFIDMSNEDKKFMKQIKKGTHKSVGNPFPSLLFSKYFPDLYDQISNAIFDLKKMGYKHTDLHAKNIMISYNKGEPYVYLIDFGIVDIKKGI